MVLFRDHPEERWLSMNRYAEHLEAALANCLPEGWTLQMPLPPSPRGGVYGRIALRTLVYPWWARQRQGTLNHVLDHSYAHLLHALDPARTVVTVHDAAPWHYPGRRLGLSRLAWRAAWRALRRARHLIVTSRFVATELERYLGVPPERCNVVALGVSERFRPTSEEERRQVRRCLIADGDALLLHVGRGQSRKDLPTVLEALARLRRQGVPATLVQVGARPHAALVDCIRRLDLGTAVHLLGYLPTRELARLYAAADVFVFPSTYEGFGLPVLEAMACGTPVVASRAAALPETVGDAGLMVDPGDPSAVAAAVETILSSEGVRAKLTARGLARAGEHTWRTTASRTLHVYRAMT